MDFYCINRRCVVSLLFICALFGISSYQFIQTHQKYIYIQRQIQEMFSYNENDNIENILDGCYHVYLDVGSNIGVQIRKLYEPKMYPRAQVHIIFDSHFGSIEDRRHASGQMVCAVGFEPNPHHTQYLKEVESSYNKCGWRVKFFTETAVSDRNGATRFYTDEDTHNMEWGGGILSPDVNNIAVDNSGDTKNQEFKNVSLVRLSDFLKNVVGKRKVPVVRFETHPPNVVMKMDIEGSEVDVIPDLIYTGGLQYINTIMVEWHQRLEKVPERKRAQQQLESIIQTLGNYSQTMKGHGGQFDFNLVNLDDETYYTSKFDLPKC